MSNETTMQPTLETVALDDLDLVSASQPDSAMDARVNFPFSATFPAATDVDLEGGHNVVHFELDPGAALATHTDSPEEILVCLDGSDVEAWVGDATGTVGAGELVVVPPMTPHGFRNEGEETARFLGFFSDRTTVSRFEAPVEPLGVAVLRT